MDKDMKELREFCLRNYRGLTSPADSGMIVALAILELAKVIQESQEKKP